MADDSPGKVQALRAIFAEKNKPLMGMMPPGGKIVNRPWQRFSDSTEELSPLKDKISNEQKVCSPATTKLLPFPAKKLDVIPALNGELHKGINGFMDRPLSKVPLKPSIGPKPAYLLQQKRTNSTLTLNSESSDVQDTSEIIENSSSRSRTFSDEQNFLNSDAKSKAFAETIASFMFTNGLSNKENDRGLTDVCNKTSVPPIPKPRTSQTRTNAHDHTELMNMCNSHASDVLSKRDSETSCCNIISSDNYICKSNYNFRRKELPPVEKLGPPPLKPIKPFHLRLPTKYCSSQSVTCPPSVQCLQLSQSSAPPLPQKPIQRPSYPCPPRPQTPPPLPPASAVLKRPVSLREEIEELYEDTLLGENKRPISLIPEYTEEEEQAEELYNDAGELEEVPMFPVPTLPLKPKEPPPPCPSEYLQPNVHGTNEELYQDAEDPTQEEFYEVMPCDAYPEESGGPFYSNNRKEIEKLRREEEKKIRKEQKEKEKREREMEKLKKKFCLTGDEIPIDDGLVKADSRGGKGDLPVKKGETVLILRMEGNPSGRWLVKNEKGKIGYVELTNIEVDPLSVKSVMCIRRLSMISTSEELYSEARSEEEAIYEVTY